MDQWKIYISRCITLAKLAGKNTKANPMVGAVLVHGDRIIGEDYHKKFGEAHAEVNCLASVKAEDRVLISQSTLYVSLEPCCIERKTPACTNLIIDNKIPNVVIGCLDPNADVNGFGVKVLKEHGINVEIVNDTQCELLISKFKANLQKRPYIILKWAQSFDNYMGHKEKQIWLSNPYSKVFAHKLRTEVDGILIGKHTAAMDNPKLNAREYAGDNPIRIVLDEHLLLDKTLHLLSDAESSIIINLIKNDKSGNKNYIKVESIRDINEVISVLYQMEIYSVLVEGGKAVLDWFIQNQLWDEAFVIKTQVRLLKEYREEHLIKAPLLEGSLMNQFDLGTDKIFHFRR